MFETGPGSGGLVEVWARIAPKPTGNSLRLVLYGWMPNNTDFSTFRDAGKRGLNLAIAGASGVYHRPVDAVDHLDEGALAHMIGSALAPMALSSTTA